MTDETAIDPTPDPRRFVPPASETFAGALVRVAYFLRAFSRKLTADAVGDYRAANRGDELTTAIAGEHRPGLHPIAWASRLADRWSVSLSGAADDPRPMAVRLAGSRDTGDLVMVTWTDLLAGVRRQHLDRLVGDYAALLSTFALSREDDAFDHMLLLSIDEPEAPAAPWVPPLPAFAATTPWHHATWRALTPTAHGADEKSGNVTRFRTELRTDRLTGRAIDLPFIAGNSVRGSLRRLVAHDSFRRVGLDPRDRSQVQPRHAHALLSGGTLDSGADTAKVHLDVRRKWRSLLPMVDLYGGVVEQQVMAGVLKVGDAIPLCRESAGALARFVRPDIAGDLDAVREWAAQLDWSADLYERRQLVRMADREIEGGEGVQMLAHTETIRADVLWVHLGFAAVPLHGEVSAVTLSCLAHAVDLWRAAETVGAQSSHSLGRMEMGDYGLGVTSALYLAHMAEHAEEIRALLARAGVEAIAESGDEGEAKAAAKGKVGRAKATKAAALEIL